MLEIDKYVISYSKLEQYMYLRKHLPMCIIKYPHNSKVRCFFLFFQLRLKHAHIRIKEINKELTVGIVLII
jgi:hypothetical protein